MSYLSHFWRYRLEILYTYSSAIALWHILRFFENFDSEGEIFEKGKKLSKILEIFFAPSALSLRLNYRLVRLNGTCQIYDFFAQRRYRRWQNRRLWTWYKTMWNIKENTFCVETCILATSLQETRRRFPSNFNLKHRQLKLAPGSKLVQKWFNKLRSLGTVDESKSPGEVDHQTTGHHRASCRLRPAEPERVHDLASGTGASSERLSMDHEVRLHIFYTWINIFSFMIFAGSFFWRTCARCQMDLSGLCWTVAATCSIVVVWWSDLHWWLTFIHCHQITKLVDPFLNQLTPRGKFQLPTSQLEVWQESPPSFLQWCDQNACLDTKRIFLDISHCLAPSSLASVLPPSVLPLCKKSWIWHVPFKRTRRQSRCTSFWPTLYIQGVWKKNYPRNLK